MAKNFVAMESDLDKHIEEKVNSLIGGGGIIIYKFQNFVLKK